MSVDDIGELEIGECETVSNLFRDEFLLFLRIYTRNYSNDTLG